MHGVIPGAAVRGTPIHRRQKNAQNNAKEDADTTGEHAQNKTKT